MALGGQYDPWDLEYLVEHGIRKVNNNKVPKRKPKRTTKYAGPGHTIVTYENRTLHYRFKQSREEYEKQKAARRRKAAKNRIGKEKGVGTVYLNTNGSYSDRRGKDVTYRTKGASERATRNIMKREIASDKYTIEDMRALLRDDHWEEVCGHKRWNYDPKSTVKEFKKYQMNRGKR